ncbi:MAG: ATP-binding protein [Flavobacteriales bacterium]|nr:ATP-binding protein [Flavobacteriales bacterium]
MYNKILCITGCDGTGKSTIIENLAKEIPNAYVAHIWDALQDSSGKLFSSKEAVDDYSCGLILF